MVRTILTFSLATGRHMSSGCPIGWWAQTPGSSTTAFLVGQFTGNRGEFYDQEEYKGRAILVRYVWTNISPKSARMEQSFSADGGKSWEVNWICDLSR